MPADGAGKELGCRTETNPDVFRRSQMTGHGAKFERKKEEAIAALLTHRNIEEAVGDALEGGQIAADCVR